MTKPRVTVVVACRNAETTLDQAIDSVLGQTERNLELIVVDDESTDASRGIVERRAIEDPRIRSAHNESRCGPGRSRNIGIGMASGEWIAILDADDWYELDRLEVLLAAAEREKTAIVADNQNFWPDRTGRIWRRLRNGSLAEFERFGVDDLLRGDRIGRAGNLGLLKPVVQRRFLETHGILYDEEIGVGEDFYFLMRCAEHNGHLLFVTRPLYNYRLQDGSISSSQSTSSTLVLLALHERRSRSLKAPIEPSTARLMEQRRRGIERYIRYKRVVDSLKVGAYRRTFASLLADPAAVLLLAAGLYRYLVRRISVGVPN